VPLVNTKGEYEVGKPNLSLKRSRDPVFFS